MENVKTDRCVMINGTEYLLGDVIALGGQSVLYRASVKSGKKEANTFVIKVPNNPEQSDFAKEEKLSAAASDASAQFVYTVFQSDSKTRASLIAKLPQSVKTLREFRDALLESVAQEDDAFPDLPRIEAAVSVIASLTEAIECLHEKAHVFHCDLSPENVIVHKTDANTVAYVIDFGSACWSDDNIVPLGKPTTPGYAAPEIMYGGEITPKSDIFSICALLLFLCGRDFMCFEGDLPELTTFGSDDLIAGAILLLQLPELVKRQLLDIILSGIYGRTYESCGQVLEALKALQKSIRFRGHDIESIRLQSRKVLKRTWDERLWHFDPDLVRPAANEDGEIVGDVDILMENTVIIAPSGIGKSVKMLCIWKDLLKTPGGRVPVFVPVSTYASINADGFIRSYISRNYIDYGQIEPGKTVDIEALLNTLAGNALLIVDGINEVSGDKSGLIREIEMFFEKDIPVTVTSCSELSEPLFRNFRRLTLLPLEKDFVEKRAGTDLSDRLAEALRLPFFMVRYLNLDKTDRGKIESAGELMLADRDRKLTQIGSTNDDNRAVIAKLVLCYILPSFAFHVNRISFSDNDARVFFESACDEVAKRFCRYQATVNDLRKDVFRIIRDVLLPQGILRDDGEDVGYSFCHENILHFYAACYLKDQMQHAKENTVPDCLEHWLFDQTQARYLGEIFKGGTDDGIHFALANWMQTHLRGNGPPLVVKKIVSTMKLLSKNFDGTTFAGLNLTQTVFYGCDLKNCDFTDAVIDEKTFIVTNFSALSEINVSTDGRIRLQKYVDRSIAIIKDGIRHFTDYYDAHRCCSAKLFPDGSAYMTYDSGHNPVLRQISSDGSIGSETVLHFQMDSGCVDTLLLHGIAEHRFAVSADCRTIAAEKLDDHSIQIWCLEDAQWCTQCVVQSEYSVRRMLALSADGKYLFVVHLGTICVYDVSKKREDVICKPRKRCGCMPDSFPRSCGIDTRVLAFGGNQLLITYMPVFTSLEALAQTINGTPYWCGFAVFDFSDLKLKYYPKVLSGFNPVTCAAVISSDKFIFGSKSGHLLVADTGGETVSVQLHMEDDNPPIEKIVCASGKSEPVIYGCWKQYNTLFSYSISDRHLSFGYEKPLFCAACSVDDSRFVTGNDDGDISLWESQQDLSPRLLARTSIWPAPADIFHAPQEDHLLIKKLDGSYCLLSCSVTAPFEATDLGCGCPYGYSDTGRFCHEPCRLAASRLSDTYQNSLCFNSSDGHCYQISWSNRNSDASRIPCCDQLSILREDSHQCRIDFLYAITDVLLLPKKGLLVCLIGSSVRIVEICSGKIIYQFFFEQSSLNIGKMLSASADETLVFVSRPREVWVWDYGQQHFAVYSFDDSRVSLRFSIPPVVLKSGVYFNTKDNGLAAFSLKEKRVVAKYNFPDAFVKNCCFFHTDCSEGILLSKAALQDFGKHGVVVTDFSTSPIRSFPVKHIYTLNIEQTNGARFIALPPAVWSMLGMRRYIATEKYRNATWIMSEKDLTLWNGKPWSDEPSVFDARPSDGRIQLPGDFSAYKHILLHIKQTGAWVLQALEEPDDIIECKSYL